MKLKNQKNKYTAHRTIFTLLIAPNFNINTTIIYYAYAYKYILL